MRQEIMNEANFLSIQGCIVDTVVFDFDGTLAKLNIDFEQMRRSVETLIARYGINFRNLRYRYVLEMINESKMILGKQSFCKAIEFETESLGMIENIELEAAQKGELFPATRNMFQSLKKRNILTGIITRNCADAVHTVFPDIATYCPVVVCRGDVAHVKPHPDHLTRALSQLGRISRRSIMIGDHPLDIETGKKAGSLTAGVLTGHFQKADFLNAGATIVLQEASQILSY
jgi:phosphoglycolate phosphatase